MKKKLLRCISTLLAIAMCMTAMSGCGKPPVTGTEAPTTEAPNETKEVEQTTEAPETDAPKEMKEAVIWLNYGHSKVFWEEKIQQYNDEKATEIGVTLVLETMLDDAYNTALDVVLQSGDLPDFFFYGSATKAHNNGGVMPLNELPGMEDMLEQYKNYIQQNSHAYGENVYALPFGITTRGLIYNKDMFVAAGLVDENGEAKPPQTFDELREYAKILTDESKQQYGIVFPLSWSSWVDSDILNVAISSEGTDHYNPVTGLYEFSTLKPVLEMIMGIKEDGSYYPGAEGLDNDPARAKFAEGNIGMKLSYSFDVGVLNTQFPAKCDWGVAPLPVRDTEDCYSQIATTGSSVMVSRNGVENIGAEACAEIIKWLYSDEVIRELYIGGYDLPCDFSIVEDVVLGDDSPTGWAGFAELASISVTKCPSRSVNLSGEKNTKNTILEDIWSGSVDIDTALTTLTARYNAGAELYSQEKPDVDQSFRYDPDWYEKANAREGY